MDIDDTSNIRPVVHIFGNAGSPDFSGVINANETYSYPVQFMTEVA